MEPKFVLGTKVCFKSSFCDFYIQLTFEEPFTQIEKIKLIDTTYIAACGLTSSRYNRKVQHLIALLTNPLPT